MHQVDWAAGIQKGAAERGSDGGGLDEEDSGPTSSLFHRRHIRRPLAQDIGAYFIASRFLIAAIKLAVFHPAY